MGKGEEKAPPKEATGRRAKRAQKRQALDKLQSQQQQRMGKSGWWLGHGNTWTGITVSENLHWRELGIWKTRSRCFGREGLVSCNRLLELYPGCPSNLEGDSVKLYSTSSIVEVCEVVGVCLFGLESFWKLLSCLSGPNSLAGMSADECTWNLQFVLLRLHYLFNLQSFDIMRASEMTSSHHNKLYFSSPVEIICSKLCCL